MKRFVFVCISLALGLGALPAAAAVPPAAGPNLQVSQVSQGSQLGVNVAQDASGNFVAVWLDASTNPAVVKARLFNASGSPKTDEIIVSPTVLPAAAPRVAMNPLGDFVVVWEISQNIFLRRFNRLGQASNHPAIDPPPTGPSHSPDVALDASGNIFAVWVVSQAGGDLIYLQQFGDDGIPLGSPQQVNQVTTFGRDTPRIAVDPAGSLLVTWNDHRGQGGLDTDIWARRFDRLSGWAAEVQINPDSTGDQHGSAPILFARGDGAVVYNDHAAGQILVRRFDTTGSPTGAPIKLGDLGPAGPSAPAAETGPDTILVAWLKDDNLVHARFFDPFWSPLSTELILSSYTQDFETDPSVAAGGAGTFVAAWTSNGLPSPIFPAPIPPGRDGSEAGAFAQAFKAPACTADSEVVCLENGRFEARVSWKNPFTGETGTGKALPLTGDTGAFWFFDPNNLELMVKVLDGRTFNSYFWVFYGSLSNVEYTLSVTDTVTGITKDYHNPPLQFGSKADITAFHAPLSLAALEPALSPPAPPVAVAADPLAAANCTPTATALCPQNRFRVEVEFIDPRTATSGQGHAAELTSDTGIFWFFGPNNLELMVKVLDGNTVNGHFWVFYGALSDVDYTITVTDTATGAQKTYHNPLHHIASSADLTAFPAGPAAR